MLVRDEVFTLLRPDWASVGRTCNVRVRIRVKVPGYPQADSVIKHAWKEIFAGIKHLWGGMNVAVSNF